MIHKLPEKTYQCSKCESTDVEHVHDNYQLSWQRCRQCSHDNKPKWLDESHKKWVLTNERKTVRF